MPIYEYTCRKGHHFEKLASFSAPSTTKCPTCGGKAEKIISLAAFHLKGSGWYSKDVAAKSGKKAEETPVAGDAPKPETAPSGKAEAAGAKETKPAKSDKAKKKKSKV